MEARRGPFVTEDEGAGTGVVIDEAGYILTTAHVVDSATSIEVTLSGDTEARTATLVASDAGADIAVLHVEDTEGLVAADVADPGSTQVGDQVIAIGNALALEGGMTVTQGIVSALDRTIETSSGTLSRPSPAAHLIRHARCTRQVIARSRNVPQDRTRQQLSDQGA